MPDHGDRSDGEPIGYKRPPEWGRFQKGQSGNPKGRPKGAGKKKATDKSQPELTESEMHLHKLIEETVTLTLNGKRVYNPAADTNIIGHVCCLDVGILESPV